MSTAPLVLFDEPRWFVCHTKPRCEKKFSNLLKAEKIEHYCPQLSYSKKYGKRTRNYTKPLMPGYVFAELKPDFGVRLFQQALLVRAIWVDNQSRLLRELEDIRRLVESGLPSTLQPSFPKGTLVRVTAGPLMGVLGMVENPKNPKGILLSVDVLRQGLLVPISADCLELID